MKPSISETGASVNVLDTIFKQIDSKWPEVWDKIMEIAANEQMRLPQSEYCKFNFMIAVTSINLRATFDRLPKAQAERIFKFTLTVFQQHFGDPKVFSAVVKSVTNYHEAYNQAMIRIESPTLEVARMLYYNLGMQNVARAVVDKPFYAPEPKMVEYLDSVLLFFAGHWDALCDKYDILPDN